MPDGEAPPGCLFCDIVAGRVPSFVVHQDDDFLAFLDIFPWTRGHLLVVPKRHVDRLTDLAPSLHGPYLRTVAALCRRVERLAPDYNIALNQGAGAGQIIFHLHVHLIPRYPGDHPFGAPHRTRLTEAEGRSVVAALTAPDPR